jgi:hypothetical protein
MAANTNTPAQRPDGAAPPCPERLNSDRNDVTCAGRRDSQPCTADAVRFQRVLGPAADVDGQSGNEDPRVEDGQFHLVQ